MDFINELLPRIEHLSGMGYWLIMLAAFLESLALVGGIVPGATLTVFAGALAAQGYFRVDYLVWCAAAGAILGDGFSFWLGARGKGWFKNTNRFLKADYLETGKRFFAKHGAKSVFLGRFVGVVRMVVPFVAGLSGMKRGRFYFWNITSALAWSASHILGGYFLGQAWRVFAVWTSRGGLFLAALIVIILCIGLMFKYAARWGKFLYEAAAAHWNSAKRTIAANPRIVKIVNRHPRFFAFMKARFDRTLFSGLPLTFFSFAFLYVLILFAGIVEDVLTLDRIVEFDANLATFLHFYRDDALVRVFLWITLLGSAKIIAVGVALATLWMWLNEKREFVAPLLTTTIGAAAFCQLGKAAFQRQRPSGVAAVMETSFSFPSGHATIAMAFYGFLAYCLWRLFRSPASRPHLLFGGGMLVLAIGFSRLYLGAHFFSDVLSGFLLGLLWLIIGISLAERKLFGKGEPAFFGGMPPKAKLASLLTIGAGAATYLVAGMYYNPLHPVPTVPETITIANENVADAFERHRLPRFIESITGRNREPLNIAFIANDETALSDAFAAADWLPADPLSLASAGKILAALAGAGDYLAAPISPLFWNGKINTLGFEKKMPGDARDRRWQVRVWTTNMTAGPGQRLFVGMVCRDAGTSWKPTRQVDPDLDAAREKLLDDLLRGGAVTVSHPAAFVGRIAEQAEDGKRFFTDGILQVIRVEASDSSPRAEPGAK